MNVIRCKSCGEYIHIGSNFGNVCIFCGSSNRAPNLAVSELTHIEKLSTQGEKHLYNRQFSEALRLYDNAIELYPDISCFYWGRLLSLHLCSNDIELLKKGVDIGAESDYFVAFHFGSEPERHCYQKIKDTHELISGDIVSLLSSLELNEQLRTDIVNKQRDSENTIAKLRDQLKAQIIELDDVEREIRDLAIDSNAMLESEKKHIDAFVSKIEAVKSEVQAKSEVTAEEYSAYSAMLTKYQNLCNAELSIIQSKANISAFAEMKKRQTEQSLVEQKINQTINRINQVYTYLQKLNISIIQIQKKYKLARKDMHNGSYGKAVSLIGDDAFLTLIQKYIKAVK